MPSATRSMAKMSALVAGLVVLASGCARHAPQTTLKPKGPGAETINNLINPVFIVAGIVFVVILGGAVAIGIKFRARGEDDYNEFPEQVHGNFKWEITWTILPLVVLMAVAVPTVFTIFDLAKKPPTDAVRVEVYGQQWWWEYRYDLNGDGNYDDIITANDLVIPAGRPVSLRIRSRDVIHSWWAPALNGKADAVPGRTHPLSIQAYKPGEYIGQCTEFCGLSHAEMRIKVVALDATDYKKWTENQQRTFVNPKGASAQAGWTTFASQCTSCHRINKMTDPSSTKDKDPAGATKIFKYPPVKNQVSGEVPNLTHFMSRSIFAGGKFNLRKDTPACNALGENWATAPNGIKDCLNRKDLESWLRNAPAEKAMAPGLLPSTNSRGMPNFNLTEDQIDQLVAFLTTLN
jgi:cytochrome c oxidase subunit 2